MGRSLSVLAAAAALLLSTACGGPAARPATAGSSPATTGPATGTTAPPPSTTPTSTGPPDHVLVVVFENKAYNQIVGSPAAPYLNSLLANSAVFTDYRAVAHPSEPNYLALFSGSTHGITDDRCPVRLGDAPNLGRQLFDAGLTFTGYSEGLPRPGYDGCVSGAYAAKHNPWVDFANLPASVNLPATAFPTDFTRLPTVAFLIPDLCHDMHDCAVATGDAWAAAQLDPYLRWARQHHSVLIVTFDEDDNSPGNHVLTLVAGATVRPGRYAEPMTHYRLLATIESLYGLAPLGPATGRQPVTDIWAP